MVPAPMCPVRSPRSASEATFTFSSPEGFRRLLLICSPTSGGGIHLGDLFDSPEPPQCTTFDTVRVQALRHSFASRALAFGGSLPMLAKLLGHSQIQTTARYANRARQSVKTTAIRIAHSLADTMDTPPGDFSTACPLARQIEMAPANRHRVFV